MEKIPISSRMEEDPRSADGDENMVDDGNKVEGIVGDDEGACDETIIR